MNSQIFLSNLFKVSIHNIELFIWKKFSYGCKIRKKKDERSQDAHALEAMLNLQQHHKRL